MPRSLYLALLVLSLIWGGSYYFIKILLHDFGPWTIACLRSAMGLAVITAVMLAMRKPFAFRRIPWVPMAVMALVNTAIPWAIIGFSETRITSSMAAVLNATTPLWTLAVGAVFFRAVTHRLQWLGVGVALIGLTILLGIGSSTVISIDPLGFAGMVGASFFYGLGAQLSKRLLQGLSMYQITFGTLLCSMLGAGAIAFMAEPVALSHLASPAAFAALAGLGLFGSGVAYILFYFIVQRGVRNLPQW
ncbi:DMT family transporter [Paenibacillus sp. P26]|nr:DMT family transporter [Paenibacillus sp. P26]